jgi:hypothetical protein
VFRKAFGNLAKVNLFIKRNEGIELGAMATSVDGELLDDELSPARLAEANIHPDTRLATDYLNHFNEVVMLIDMLPMMPDCAPDVVTWAPVSYTDHFYLSHFKGRDLAIRAYQTVERNRRETLERTIFKVEQAIGDIQRMIREAPMDCLPVEAIQDLADMRIKPALAHAMGLINGAPVVDMVTEESGDAQQAVDALFS